MIRYLTAAMLLMASPAMASELDADQIEMKAYVRMVLAAQQCNIMPPPSMGSGIHSLARKYHMDPMVTAKHIDEAAWRAAQAMTRNQIFIICEHVRNVYRKW